MELDNIHIKIYLITFIRKAIILCKQQLENFEETEDVKDILRSKGLKSPTNEDQAFDVLVSVMNNSSMSTTQLVLRNNISQSSVIRNTYKKDTNTNPTR